MKNKLEAYKILRLDPTATSNDIKKAYKQLALKYHPDKHSHSSPSEKAAAEYMFTELADAYEILTEKNIPHLAVQRSSQINEDSIIPYQGEENKCITSTQLPLPLAGAENLAEIDTVISSGMKQHILGFIRQSKAKFEKLIGPFGDLTEEQIIQKIKNSRKDIIENPRKYIPDFIGKTNFTEQEPFENLTEEQINQKIKNYQEKYKDIPEHITEKAFLWKAEKKDCALVYVFGSMHQVAFDIDDIFGDALDNVIDKVDEVYFEVHPDDFLSSSYLFSTDQSKQEIEGKETNSIEGLDSFIAKKVISKYKKARYLENYLIRTAADSGLEIPCTSYNQMNQQSLNITSENYLTHVSPSQADLNFAQDIPISKATIKRNLFWMESILTNSQEKQKASLIVCGAVHNAGRFGLPNLLASQGYALSPLMKTPPISKNTLIRDACKHNSTFFISKSEEKKSEQEQTLNTLPRLSNRGLSGAVNLCNF